MFRRLHSAHRLAPALVACASTASTRPGVVRWRAGERKADHRPRSPVRDGSPLGRCGDR